MTRVFLIVLSDLIDQNVAQHLGQIHRLDYLYLTPGQLRHRARQFEDAVRGTCQPLDGTSIKRFLFSRNETDP